MPALFGTRNRRMFFACFLLLGISLTGAISLVFVFLMPRMAKEFADLAMKPPQWCSGPGKISFASTTADEAGTGNLLI